MDSSKDLIAAAARLSRMIRRHPMENDSLSHMGYRVLRAVQQNNGIRTKELAEQAGVRPASISEALNRLENDGYVIRVKDASDSRVKRVYITDKTREQLEERTKIKQAENDRLLACLTEEEATVFLTACDKLCACLAQDTPAHRRPHGKGNAGHHHHNEEEL